MLKKIFLDHPRTVDESYIEHLQTASSFGFAMIVAGFACLLHGIIPIFFTRTGSTAVRRLHERMVTSRIARSTTV